MRSLGKQLPAAAFVLLIVVGVSVTLAAYQEGRAPAAALHEERLTRLADQLATTIGTDRYPAQRRRHARDERPRCWASDAVVRHGILDGKVPFLQKPFSSQQLGLEIREILDASSRS